MFLQGFLIGCYIGCALVSTIVIMVRLARNPQWSPNEPNIGDAFIALILDAVWPLVLLLEILAIIARTFRRQGSR